jgi:hypothetical protein
VNLNFEQTQKLVADIDRIAMAQERIAVAVEQIADTVRDEAKIGGGLDAIGRVAEAIHALTLEVSAIPGAR